MHMSWVTTLVTVLLFTSHEALADNDVISSTPSHLDLEDLSSAEARTTLSYTYFVNTFQKVSSSIFDITISALNNSSSTIYRDNVSTNVYDVSTSVTNVFTSVTVSPSSSSAARRSTTTRTEILASTVVLAIFCVFGTIGNIVSMYVYFPRGKQHNLYVFYLSIIDFIMSSILIPFTITIFYATPIPTVLLYLYSVGLVLIVLQSIEILVFISVDRYVACSHPQMYRKVQRYAKYIIGGQIVFNCGSLALSLIPQASIVFAIVSQLIIVGSFVTMVVIYIVIFFVLRRRMSNILPASEPTLPTAQPENTAPPLQIANTAIDPESPDVEEVQSPSSASILVKMITPPLDMKMDLDEVKLEPEAAKVKFTPEVEVIAEGNVTTESKVIVGYTKPLESTTTVSRNKRVNSRLTNSRTRNLVATIRMFCAITVVFVISYLPTYLVTYKLVSLPQTFAYSLFINHVANPAIYFALSKTYRDRVRILLASIIPCCCTTINRFI